MEKSSTVDGNVHLEKADWSGATAPFKTSYGKLMMWYFLLSDAFTFAGFLIAYGALRMSMATWPVSDFVFSKVPYFPEINAPLIFVTFMTFVLLASSFTMVRAVQEGQRENKKGVAFWMLLTIIGGIGFLSCQAWEWKTLIVDESMTLKIDPFGTHTEHGEYLDDNGKASGETFVPGDSYLIHNLNVQAHDTHDSAESAHHAAPHHTTPGDYKNSFIDEKGYVHRKYIITEGPEINRQKYESFGPREFGALFYTITGFHGFHVLSGVIFLIIIMLNVVNGLYVDRKNGYEMVEKIGLYWHFVDLVWIFVFLVFYLI